MKYLHKIIIGKQTQRPFRYSYGYKNTKNILISISSKGVAVEMLLTKKLTKEKMIDRTNYLVIDAVKKALLLYLVRYSKNLSKKEIFVQIEEKVYKIDNSFKVYSIVEGELLSKMHKGWKNKSVVQDILWFTKSTSKQRMASLYAILIAKSKKFESEKFFYLWISFNGMYGYFSRLIEKEQSIMSNNRESVQIRYFQQLNNWGQCNLTDNNGKTQIAQKVISILKNCDFLLSKEFLQSEKGYELSQNIKKCLVNHKDNKSFNITVYGYLLSQLTYYYRCSIFHANTPTSLFALESEHEISVLRQLNALLEVYLDENLYLWFDEEYRNDYLKLKAKSIEILKR